MNNSTILIKQDLANFDIPVALIPMPYTQQVYRISAATLGFLTNTVVFVVICNSRQLHYPRHIFWAAISLFSFFSLANITLKLIVVTTGNQIICYLYVLGAGAHYSVLLICLVLSALDRYLAIACYSWYKSVISNRVVISVIVGFVIFTYIAVTSPFWLGFQSVTNCTVNMTHMFVVNSSHLIFGFLCVILQVMVFVQSRSAIRKYSVYFSQPNNIQLRFTSPSRRQNGSRFLQGNKPVN